MKLLTYHVTFVTLVISVSTDNLSKPLPEPNPQLVNRFRLALEAVVGIGIRLQAFLQDDEENFLVSPISAANIVGELVLGAEGEFRKQLIDLLALKDTKQYENENIYYYHHSRRKNVSYSLPYGTIHLQLSNLLKALESETNSKIFILKLKSAIFIDDAVTLNETFRKSVQVLYKSQIFKVNFAHKLEETQSIVNNWVKQSTNGLITSIYDSPPLPTTKSIFANAIYFKGEWEIPFSDILNRQGYFNITANKSVPVTYMIGQLDQILYSEAEDYRLVALPYTNEELGMYIILPKKDNPLKYDIKAFVQSLKARHILQTIEKAKRRDVVIKIPKMTISKRFSILDQLKKYRVFKKKPLRINSTNALDKIEDRVEAFQNFTTEEEKDIVLSGAAIGEKLRVDDIIQQVVISINEKGTEAAAVSAAAIDYIGGAKNFIIERPFVFFIKHEKTSATLFWGAVSNPSA